MVAYSFKARFAEPILAGTKLHTVRAPRKRHARPGEGLQLYTGMRTRQCKLIARKTCAAVLAVIICPQDDWVAVQDLYPWPGIAPEWALPTRRKLTYVDVQDFARRDGFKDWEEMRAFWREEHPETRDQSTFEGVLIGWWAP
jgi:hypothetical protein